MPETTLVELWHRPTNTLLAAGARGWRMTQLEGNWYVHKRCVAASVRMNGLPGLCFYKGLYVWADLHVDGQRFRNVGWKYVLPNPLLPFIWWRFAFPGRSPDVEVRTRRVVDDATEAPGARHPLPTD